jgi:Fic family protein
MTAPDRDAPSDTAQADRLYRGFPDFAVWVELTPTDIDLWGRFASSLEERRKTATPETLNAAVEVAVRAAALDTGAIEGLYTTDRGFTMTVALQHLAWEQMIEERGAGVRELFEAQLEAYELVLDAVTRKLSITEAWIRALHEKLCGPQKTIRVLTEVGWQEQELPKGQYKTHPNHVRLSDGTFHAYSPVDRVQDEMHRLLEQIRTPEFEAAHPVLQASYLHYGFVVIHPFADGNGRVARALASVFFYRAESIPLVIFSNQRLAYIDALALADRGEHEAVISFFLDRGIDTMQLVIENLLTAQAPKPEAIKGRFLKALNAKRELPWEEMESLSNRVLDVIKREFHAQFDSLTLSDQISLSFSNEGRVDFYPASPAYRSGESSMLVILNGPNSQTELPIASSILKNQSLPFAFVLGSANDRLEIRLQDISPEITPNLQLRLSNWVHRQLGRMLSDLTRQTAT